MKTFSAKPGEIKPNWVLIDAEGLVLGRLASLVALKLRGKDKPQYTPHVDCGDYVIIINADKLALTGQKKNKKKYFWHTGYPGGIKERTADEVLDGKYPERVLLKAVKRMLPKESPLAKKQFSKLKVYSGENHPHEAQKPEVINISILNKKNVKGSING
ncbi:MAG: 50S ribosomal protein L13 [Rhodospirillaceae bacterium]|nr:50S ribosomal protein L13 [Rhodospirillaceae bacterium]|tara:strand:- start:3658 stop:4134 length:477 start_codon:yes stop_codon:yes gene_type:complete